MKKFFQFEVEILDDKNEKKVFKACNYQVLKNVVLYFCRAQLE